MRPNAVARGVLFAPDAEAGSKRYRSRAVSAGIELDRAFAALARGGLEARVIHVEGARRPLFVHDLRHGGLLAYLVRPGASGPEVRVLDLLLRDELDLEAARSLLRSAGELWFEGPSPALLEERTFLGFPANAESALPTFTPRLDDYLDAPSIPKVPEQDGSVEPASIHRSGIGDRLTLVPQQEEVIAGAGPWLISGTAGSGKTLMLACKCRDILLSLPPDDVGNGGRVLFVVYTASLKDYATYLLQRYCERPTLRRRLERVDVFTYTELCERLFEEHGLPFRTWVRTSERSDSQSLSIKRIKLFLEREKLSMNLLPGDVLEEIRGVIKGGNLSLDSDLLSPKQYITQKAGGSIYAEPKDREALHRAAQEYQSKLRSGEVDEMDAARRLLRERRRSGGRTWTHVLVDEVQDYTPIQIALLADLAEDASGIALAGDEEQTIHPSGFTWGGVERALRHRQPSLRLARKHLAVNLRNHGLVNQFAHSVHSLGASLLGDPPTPLPDSHLLKGDAPILLEITGSELREVLGSLVSRTASFGLIAANERVLNKVQGKKFGDEKLWRAFLPHEVKGLEFEVTCLLDFGTTYVSLADSAPKSRRKRAHARRAFREAYVSLTRSRSRLLLVETRAAHSPIKRSLWDAPELSPRVQRLRSNSPRSTPKGLAEQLESMLGSPGPSDERRHWFLRAQYLEMAGLPLPAAECWERIGEFGRASELFEEGRRPSEAARCAMEAQLFDRAARLYAELGDMRGIARARDAVEDWEGAAEAHAQREDWRRAAVAYRRGGVHAAAARAWERHGDWASGARSYARAGLPGEAARCLEAGWRTLGCRDASPEDGPTFLGRLLPIAAAELWSSETGDPRFSESIRRHLDAKGARISWPEYNGLIAPMWIQAGDPDRAAIAFSRANRRVEAGMAYESAGNVEAALAEFRSAGAWDRAACLLDAADRKMEAREAWWEVIDSGTMTPDMIDVLRVAGHHDLIALWWEKSGEPEKARAEWKRMGEFLLDGVGSLAKARAWVCFDRAKEWDAAREAWSLAAPEEGAGSASLATRRRAEAFGRTFLFVEASRELRDLNELEAAYDLLVRAREWEAAVELRLVRDPKGAAELALENGLKRRAAELLWISGEIRRSEDLYSELGLPMEVVRKHVKKGRGRDALDFLERTGRTDLIEALRRSHEASSKDSAIEADDPR